MIKNQAYQYHIDFNNNESRMQTLTGDVTVKVVAAEGTSIEEHTLLLSKAPVMYHLLRNIHDAPTPGNIDTARNFISLYGKHIQTSDRLDISKQPIVVSYMMSTKWLSVLFANDVIGAAPFRDQNIIDLAIEFTDNYPEDLPFGAHSPAWINEIKSFYARKKKEYAEKVA